MAAPAKDSGRRRNAVTHDTRLVRAITTLEFVLGLARRMHRHLADAHGFGTEFSSPYSRNLRIAETILAELKAPCELSANVDGEGGQFEKKLMRLRIQSIQNENGNYVVFSLDPDVAGMGATLTEAAADFSNNFNEFLKQHGVKYRIRVNV